MTHSTNPMLTVSVFDLNSDRQAQNLDIDCLADAVKAWFIDWDDADVREAVNQLSVPSRRAAAAEYLGLNLQLAA